MELADTRRWDTAGSRHGSGGTVQQGNRQHMAIIGSQRGLTVLSRRIIGALLHLTTGSAEYGMNRV